MTNSRFFLAVGLALAAGAASAASPVGSWTGKFTLQGMPPLPSNLPPQQKAMIQQSMAMATKIRLKLTVKADKTFSIKYMGTPNSEKQPPHNGTWSQKGNVVTTVSKTVQGPPQQLVLSPDGKTMTLVLPNNRGKLVFTR